MKYLVIDLEATCDEKMAREDMEIIEIGAVMLDDSFNPIDEYQAFIKPILNPELTQYCKDLTSITQSEINTANTFNIVIKEFEEWIGSQDDMIFLSWGMFDMYQFQKDYNRHNLKYKLPKHQNAKQLFSQALGVKKGYGMVRALNRCHIPLDGTHHRGIDDARNIAKLIPYCYGKKQIK